MIYYILLIITIFINYSFVTAESLLDVAIPTISSNAVTNNDCNLNLLNPKLLELTLGNDSEQGISANDVIFAYNQTITSCKNNTKTLGSRDTARTTNFIHNLCSVAIAKLTNTTETQAVSRIPYAVSKKLYEEFKKSRINPSGYPLGYAKEQLRQALGEILTLSPYTTPQQCGRLVLSNTEGLYTLFLNIPKQIQLITEDCRDGVSTDEWLSVRKAMTNGSLSVFGGQGSTRNRQTDIEQCALRIQQVSTNLETEAQNTSLITYTNYVTSNLEKRGSYLIGYNETLRETLSTSADLFSMAQKQTPITPICTYKS